MKTVALYSPYIPKHAGGGERYLLSIAEVTSWDHETFLLVPPDQVEATQKSLARYSELFGLRLERVNVRPTAIGSGKNPLGTMLETKKYDVLFAMTDGSIFPSLASKSYLIMQVPWTRSLQLSERLKLKSWNDVIVYSDFVKNCLQKSWKINSLRVLSPYVDTRDFQPVPVENKEKLIISVGRFFSHTQSNSKRQDILIEAFTRLVTSHHLKGWHLSLLGNVDPNADSQAFMQKLKEMARGYPITIHTDLSYDALRAFYSRASIYWHAAGFEVDQQVHPENTEHFGITTLEAMASGCIPLVVPKGGQPEIIKRDALYWNTTEELESKTARLIGSMHSERKAWQKLSNELVSRANAYSKAVFEREVHTTV